MGDGGRISDRSDEMSGMADINEYGTQEKYSRHPFWLRPFVIPQWYHEKLEPAAAMPFGRSENRIERIERIEYDGYLRRKKTGRDELGSTGDTPDSHKRSQNRSEREMPAPARLFESNMQDSVEEILSSMNDPHAVAQEKLIAVSTILSSHEAEEIQHDELAAEVVKRYAFKSMPIELSLYDGPSFAVWAQQPTTLIEIVGQLDVLLEVENGITIDVPLPKAGENWWETIIAYPEHIDEVVGYSRRSPRRLQERKPRVLTY